MSASSRPVAAEVVLRPMLEADAGAVLDIDRQVHPDPWSPDFLVGQLAAVGRWHHVVADRNGGVEIPHLGHIEAISVDTALDEDAHFRLQISQRTLNTIVDLSQQTRAELNRQGLPSSDHGLARTDAGRLLVDLDNRLVSMQFDDFTHQSFISHAHDFVHSRGNSDSGYDRT